MTQALVHARSIVSKLVRAGFTAYFAGGWVRDYIMNHPSEDIDIATDATAAQIMDLFPHTLLVGLAFGVVIVVISEHQFEVATFRKDLPYLDGRHPQGIEQSTPREDALRRDFTINGMFYDPLEEKIYDYVDGQQDIERGVIRAIGDPNQRFFEDRLRMLRAFRFAARFGFAIDLATQEAIVENANLLLPSVAMERIWQEFEKMANFIRFDQALIDMHRLRLLAVIFPELQHLHLHDLQTKISAFKHFPSNCPTILYIMQMFIDFPIPTKLAIAKRLKVSNNDIKLLEWVERLRKVLLKANNEPFEWAVIFAHKDVWLGLYVIAALAPDIKRLQIIEDAQARYEKLKVHVERLQKNQPLVTSGLLHQCGISSGKQMGLLLKEAQRISVNADWHSAEQVIAKLMTNPLWQQQ